MLNVKPPNMDNDYTCNYLISIGMYSDESFARNFTHVDEKVKKKTIEDSEAFQNLEKRVI